MPIKRRGGAARKQQVLKKVTREVEDIRRNYVKAEMAKASAFGRSNNRTQAQREGAAKRAKQAGGTGRYTSLGEDRKPKKIKAAPKKGRNKAK